MPPCFELFFAPLEVLFDPNTCERIGFAYVESKYGHAEQVRDDGSRFFDHPKSAAWIYINELGGRDPRIIVELLLHDIPEDQYLLSFYRISVNFGQDIALDVRSLTKLPKGKESFEDNLNRIIARGPWSIVAKSCDRLDNVRKLGGCKPKKRKNKIEETKKYVLPLLFPALRACGEEWVELADILERKLNEALNEYK
jgi:(p)ppGpp synthase/HD superfamily hydrolase